MSVNKVGHRIVWLDEINSTNDFAAGLAKEENSHGKVIATLYQSEGRGQRGSNWDSEPNQNLLFSVILHPTTIEVQKQFILSKLAAVSVCDLLKPLVSNVSIKWPNDIYIGSCKVAGILIENSFSSAMLDTTIIGIGINVNQDAFSADLPNPTSLLLEVDKRFDINELLVTFCDIFERRYSDLIRNAGDSLSSNYFSLLYRKDEYCDYMADNVVFRAKIFGVRNSGELILETEDGKHREFTFKEVSFII
jgi:BirA family transcriptional regulator, biotin operon repressor / biotin---[acetyl-CoA-carboxylase] ligase